MAECLSGGGMFVRCGTGQCVRTASRSSASLLGRVTIGRGSSIGGNVWLTHSVPPGSNVTQVSAREDGFHDGAGI